MAIDIISRIQNRRGLYADLPAELAEGEIGFCLDTRQVFIGNSPGYGMNTQILTEYSQNDEIITTTYQNSGSNLTAAIPRTLQSKLNDIVSIKDFGAKGDGVTDDAPAINAAIAQLLQGYPQSGNLAVTLYFPPGTYMISSEILLYPYITIQGAGVNCTSINAAPGSDLLWMFETADSLGQTGANIGLNGATLPLQIGISDININTNGTNITAIKLVRYQHFKIFNCFITGGWNNSLAPDSESGIWLASIGNVNTSTDFRMHNTSINGFSNGVFCQDPVSDTRISFSKISECYRGVNSYPANYSGPVSVNVSHSIFSNIKDWGLYNSSSNPFVSIGNNYNNVGNGTTVKSIFWEVSSQKNISIGDSFGYTIGVVDNGSLSSIILNPGQTNISGLSANKISNTNLGINTAISLDNISIELGEQAGGVWIYAATVTGASNWVVNITYNNTSVSSTIGGTFAATTSFSALLSSIVALQNISDSLVVKICDLTNEKYYELRCTLIQATVPYYTFISLEQIS